MPLKWLGEHLMIKRKFINKILRREKRATIRLGKVRVKAKKFFIHSGGKIIAKAKLVKVVYKRVKDLTDQDAIIDGFRNREELLNELKMHYGEINEDDLVTIIIFDIEEILDIPEGKYPANVSPYEIAKLALENLNLREEDKKILTTLVKTKSIRKTAKKHFGRLSERWRIRKLLAYLYNELAKKGYFTNISSNTS